MDDVVFVSVGDGVADVLEQPGESPAGRLASIGFVHLREGLALDQLHCQEGPPVRQPTDLMHRRNARVLQLTGDPGLLEEPLDQRFAVSEPGAEDLDRDVSFQVLIDRLVDDPHPAPLDQRGQRVTGD